MVSACLSVCHSVCLSVYLTVSPLVTLQHCDKTAINYGSQEASLFLEKPSNAWGSIARIVCNSWAFLQAFDRLTYTFRACLYTVIMPNILCIKPVLHYITLYYTLQYIRVTSS